MSFIGIRDAEYPRDWKTTAGTRNTREMTTNASKTTGKSSKLDLARWPGGYLHLESPIRGWAAVSGACVQFIRHPAYPRRVYCVEGIQIGPLQLPVGMFGKVPTTR